MNVGVVLIISIREISNRENKFDVNSRNIRPSKITRYTVLSPLHHDRKPLIFQWAFTLRNAGIGSVSNPAFYTLKNEWLPVVTKRRR